MLRNDIVRASVVGACFLVAGAVKASTTSHAMTTVGRAQGGSGIFGCATSGPQPLVLGFFNAGIGLPTEGYSGCNLGGNIVDNSAAGGTTASSSANGSFNDGTAHVESAAHADYDHVGTEASGTFTGYTDNKSYHASEAAALVYDTLTVNGTGQGTITMGFTIDGAMNAIGNSEAFTQLNYQLGDGPDYAGFLGKVYYGDNFYTAYGTSDLSGLTAAGASLSGTASIATFDLPIVFGTTYDWTYGLYSAAYPGPGGGAASSDFISTARLTSITVKDSSGQARAFSITSGSGTIYDENGAHLAAVDPVPEPATWAMMIAGFGAVGMSLRRSRRIGSVARL